jgi:glycosidase
MFSQICSGCFSRRAGLLSVAAMSLALCGASGAQTAAAPSSKPDALSILKIDPPNWWATLPKPMLLVQGTGLHDATFTLSDLSLHIEKAVPSENGHYIQLWLSASPAAPETVTLTAHLGTAKVDAPYTFLPRHAPSDGFAGFSSRDLLYLIMTDRFADGDPTNDGPTAHSAADSPEAIAARARPRGWHGGDLRGIADHLDYLQQLGVTAVWPTPVYQNHEPDSYHGYGATDMYAVDEHYGSLADLKSLAASLHARHMKLVLDTVPNHIGPNHPWVADEPAPNWFHGTKANHRNAESNFNALIDPHAPERDRLGTLTGWFANVLPDMNTDDPTVALYLRQNAIWWIESTGADALRIDTFPYVNREFWHDFNGELKTLYPNLTEVGEAFNPDPVIVSSFADGVTRAGVDTRLYTPFDFPTFFALRNVFAPGPAQSGFKPDPHTPPGQLAPMSKLADVLAADALYPHPERLVTFVGNHDTSRILTATNSEALVRLGFAYIFTTRGMPQVYSGDEIAMTGGDDPDNRHDFPGGFAPSTQNAFTPETRTPQQQQMFSWVAQLSTIRHKHDALACGAEQVLASNDDWIVYLRDTARAPTPCGTSNERVLVAIHRAPTATPSKPSTLDVKLSETWLSGCTLAPPALAPAEASATITADTLHLQLPGNEALIASCH